MDRKNTTGSRIKKLTEVRITISAQEAELLYGIDAGHLANLRYRREGAPFFKIGRKAFYKKTEFEAWLFSNPVLTLRETRE